MDVLGASAIKEGNAIVEEIIGSPSNLQNSHITLRSTKSGKYITFSSKDRDKIRKYCSQNGPTTIVRKFKFLLTKVEIYDVVYTK